MGFDLSNSYGGYQRFNGAGWALALTVAERSGWRPAGTPKPESWDDANGPWQGEYAIQCGQQVTREDALAFAAALDRAISSDDFIASAQQSMNELNAEVVRQVPQARSNLGPLATDEAEKFRLRLVELAKFAHQGPFVIE
jgi:hypothetical protein